MNIGRDVKSNKRVEHQMKKCDDKMNECIEQVKRRGVLIKE
jgi:hypothetical protein